MCWSEELSDCSPLDLFALYSYVKQPICWEVLLSLEQHRAAFGEESGEEWPSSLFFHIAQLFKFSLWALSLLLIQAPD